MLPSVSSCDPKESSRTTQNESSRFDESMARDKSHFQQFFNAVQNWFIKGTSVFRTPIDALVQFISTGVSSTESSTCTDDNKCLAVGRAMFKRFQERRLGLEKRKLNLRQTLFLERESLCQLAREHRQLLSQLQILKYKEDASIANRNMLLELLQEVSTLRQRHIRLKSDLQLLQCGLDSYEVNNDIEDEQSCAEFNCNKIHKSVGSVDRMDSNFTSMESFNSQATWVTSSELSTCVSLESD